jgi:hypothetical protein
MIRKVWESRNFMEFNNWCQITQCRLLFEQSELPDKRWRTFLTIKDERGILNRTITGTGVGHNKKESKTMAMRQAMESLMNFRLIHLGIKDKRFMTEYYQMVKNESFGEEEAGETLYSTNKSLISSPRHNEVKKPFDNNIQIKQETQQDILNNEVPREVPKEVEGIINGNKANVLMKILIKEIKDGKFEECCGYLKEIIKLKKLEWIEFANIWNYSLEKKNIRYIRKLIDIISSNELEEDKNDYYLKEEKLNKEVT